MKKALHFLKATGLMSLILLLSSQTFAQTASPPSAGDGSQENPYEIANLENLYWLSQNDTDWDKHYIQTADIDASPTKGWDNDSGFTPIGNSQIKFTGTYNGQHHKIDSLFINRRSENNIGLFGFIDDNSQVEKLDVTNVNITGRQNVGSIAGKSKGLLDQCSATGNVYSNVSWINIMTGGLVGINNDTIKNSFSKIKVGNFDLEAHKVGGIAGKNGANSLIVNCYSQGEVWGGEEVGGLVGDNANGKIKYCYSTSDVRAWINYSGGLVGYGWWSNTENSFWDVETSGYSSSEGGTGKITQEMKSPCTYINGGWDFINETNNGEEDVWGINPNENGGYPFLSWQGFVYQTPLSVKTQKTTNIDSTTATGNIKILAAGTSEITAHGVCWDTTATPTFEDNYTNEGSVSDTGTFASNISGLKTNTTYHLRAYVTNSDTTIYGNDITFGTLPFYSKPSGEGTKSNPYQIANFDNLAWLMVSDTAWNKHYIQIADIDASATNTWYSRKGFIPIGNSTTKFTGTYNGQYHKIDSLYINRKYGKNIGLFGFINGDSSQIEKLSVTKVNITGNENVGSIVGKNKGSLNQCSATGKINGYGTPWDITKTGGLAGVNSNTIKNSFTKINVTSGGALVGGITGKNGNNSLVKNCYSQGKVSHRKRVGGIVGENYNGKVKYCYSTSTVNGKHDVGGIVGLNNGGTTENSFWDTETSGQNNSDGGIGLTIEEMQEDTTYKNAGWGFACDDTDGNSNNWVINTSGQDEYPFLAWQAPYMPSLKDISAECSANIEEEQTATDSCGNTIPATTSDPLEYKEQGTYIITWQYEDDTEKYNQQQTVIINDITPPTLSCLDTQTVELSRDDTIYTVSGNEFAPGKINDNCEINSITNDYNSAETLDGTEFPLGTTTIKWTITDKGGNVDSCSSVIEVLEGEDEDETGIKPIREAGIKLYPNPFRDFIMIESEREIIKIEIADMTGITRIIENKKKRINTSELEEGIYMIILEDEQGNRYQSKMIRQ